MQSSDLLLTVAQIAIGLAGFSAIIVTLNPNPIREWDVTDRLNLRVLVQVSFVVLFFSLLPFVLTIPLEIGDSWFYGLWLYGLYHIVDVGSFLFVMTKETPTIFRRTASVGVCVASSQIGIALLGTPVLRETAYVATLVWHLYVIFMAFVLLLYQLRKNT
jgi:hypothetical protein